MKQLPCAFVPKCYFLPKCYFFSVHRLRRFNFPSFQQQQQTCSVLYELIVINANVRLLIYTVPQK